MAVVGSIVLEAIAAPALGSILAAVAAVGAATTVVGIVTGKPNLIKIGGELGLVGGLGGLANSAFQSLGSAALSAGGAGVAEGALPGAYSDIAGEQFALSAGQDAAGSGFSTAAGAATGDAAGGLASDATSALTSSANAPAALDSVVMPKTPGIIDSAQSAAPPAGAADLTKLTGAPTVSADGIAANTPELQGTSIGTNAGGMYTGEPTPFADAATPTISSGTPDFTMNADDVQTVTGTPGATQSDLAKLKAKVGAEWNSMSQLTKAFLLKSALAIPGGIQAQRNKERELDINQQAVNQHSYGSAVPTFGIIAKAQKVRAEGGCRQIGTHTGTQVSALVSDSVSVELTVGVRSSQEGSHLGSQHSLQTSSY